MDQFIPERYRLRLHERPSLLQRTLQAAPEVTHAEIVLNDGTPFADYSNLNRNKGVDDEVVYAPIAHQGERLGTLKLYATDNSIRELMHRALLISLAMGGVALLLAGLASRWLACILSRPLIRLAEVAALIARDNNYTLRADEAERVATGNTQGQYFYRDFR